MFAYRLNLIDELPREFHMIFHTKKYSEQEFQDILVEAGVKGAQKFLVDASSPDFTPEFFTTDDLVPNLLDILESDYGFQIPTGYVAEEVLHNWDQYTTSGNTWLDQGNGAHKQLALRLQEAISPMFTKPEDLSEIKEEEAIGSTSVGDEPTAPVNTNPLDTVREKAKALGLSDETIEDMLKGLALAPAPEIVTTDSKLSIVRSIV